MADILLVIFVVCVVLVATRIFFMLNRAKSEKLYASKIIGILHPYSNGGGGGERVLWWLIRTIQSMDNDVQIVLYSKDDNVDYQKKAKTTFNIDLLRPVKVVKLNTLWIAEYPDKKKLPFTLLVQSLATIIMGLEAIIKLTPQVFIDTYGAAFTMPAAKILAGCKTCCYVHYPTISTDMLDSVSNRRKTMNNDERIINSTYKTSIKIIYYRFFALLYAFVGYFVDVVMVNSTWTHGHISYIWRGNSSIHTVYPPCPVKEFSDLPINQERKNHILSIGQFRPEKDHTLQLESFQKLLSKYSSDTIPHDLRLVLLGGVRDEFDEERVHRIKEKAKELGVYDRVDFLTNASFATLKKVSGESLIGLHCMWNEHFGICVVEYMASGLIPLAHKSGGPLLDIVDQDKNGFLADNSQEYADRMYNILQMNKGDQIKLQMQARIKSQKFSDENFEDQSKCVLKLLLKF
ncbi:alpha-1,2-mannosyltransferase [Acrasis kona]|uniref:GDP-Man:Man(3)GlcNAc(2)-PP-Dol alpha-1,2-mannosyltransferase n=1 Tax=Acrasis kona TaxID=1008807 RepID=A0AAW2Z9C4_9EUKA